MKKNSLLIALFLLIGVSFVVAAKVTVDYNHATSFSNYKSYSWLNVKAGNPLWVDRIRSAVDTQLTSKGMTKTDSGGDASIAAFGSSREQKTLQTFYNGFGGGWGWRGFGDGVATTTTEITPIGTLVVDMFDTPSKKLVWRGVASDTLSDKPEKNEKKLAKAVEEMFDKFPPKAKE